MCVRSSRDLRDWGEPAARAGRGVVVRPVLAHARRQPRTTLKVQEDHRSLNVGERVFANRAEVHSASRAEATRPARGRRRTHEDVRSGSQETQETGDVEPVTGALWCNAGKTAIVDKPPGFAGFGGHHGPLIALVLAEPRRPSLSRCA